MALTEKLPRVQYTASGSASFLFNFPIWDSSELEVYVDDELQDSSKYSVSFTAGDESGGTVIFTTAPTSGAIVTIVRRHDQERTSDFSLTGPFSVSALNEQLDRLTAQVQDLQEQVNRSLRYKVTNTESFPYQIPGMEFPSPQASRVIGYGPDGKPSLYTPQSDSSVLTLNAIRQTFTATEGQTVFDNLGFTYTPGSNELTVYVNGVRQTLNQYSETDSSTVTFNSPLSAGDVVEFVLNEWTGQDASDSQLRTDSVEEVHDNIASLISITPPTYRKVAFVKGYHTPGDGGGGVFYWDDSEPKSNHNGGTIIDPTQTFPINWSDTAQQSTWFTAGGVGTGCWKRVYSGAVTPEHFGAKGDGVTDDTLPLNQAADTSSKVSLARHYKISDCVVFDAFNEYFIQSNSAKITIDENGNFVSGDATGHKYGIVFGKLTTAEIFSTYTTLAAAASNHDYSISVSDGSQFTAGDIICIWDDTASSFSSYRLYYYNGEYAEIQSVSGNTIYLKGGLKSRKTYPIGTKIYKMAATKFHFVGKLEVVTPSSLNLDTMDTVVLHGVANSKFDTFHLINSNYEAFTVKNCYNVVIDNITGYSDYTGFLNVYLIGVLNSQQIRNNYIYGFNWWHSYTTGGGNYTCAVVNRDISIGHCSFYANENTSMSGMYQIGIHGNIDGFFVDSCYLQGGLVLAGVNTKVSGVCYTNDNGIGVYFSEVSGYNHDVGDLRIYQGGSLSSYSTIHAIFDFGANSSADQYAYEGGRVIVPKYIHIGEDYTGSSLFPLINISLNNPTFPEGTDIIISDLVVDGITTTNPLLITVRSISGDNIPFAYLNNIKANNPIQFNLSAIDKTDGIIAEFKGSFTHPLGVSYQIQDVDCPNFFGTITAFADLFSDKAYQGTSVTIAKQLESISDATNKKMIARLVSAVSDSGTNLTSDLTVYYRIKLVPAL